MCAVSMEIYFIKINSCFKERIFYLREYVRKKECMPLMGCSMKHTVPFEETCVYRYKVDS